MCCVVTPVVMTSSKAVPVVKLFIYRNLSVIFCSLFFWFDSFEMTD